MRQELFSVEQTTYVLVPGAWFGGWAWRPVAERIRASGHRAVTLTLPGLGDGEGEELIPNPLCIRAICRAAASP